MDQPAEPTDWDPRGMAGWFLAAAGIILVTGYVYAPVLDNQWILYDNSRVIHGHPGVTQPSFSTIFSNEPYWKQAILYQPLVVLSLAIDRQLFGYENKSGWAWHSLLLHLLAMLLLLGLLYRLTASLAAAFAGTLIVTGHPLVVETVTWIICRTFLLTGFWILLGSHLYLSYLHRPRWWLLAGQIVCFAISMLAKPLLGIVLLPILLDLWQRRRITARALFEKLPLLLVAVVFALVNVQAVSPGEGAVRLLVLDWSTFLQRVFQGTVLTLANTFFPDKLTVFYQYNGAWQVIGWRGIAAGIAVLVWIILVIAAWQRFGRQLLLCGLAWLIVFLPQLAAIRYRNTLTADRYACIPLWFVALACAAVIAWFLRREPTPSSVRQSAGYALAVLCAVLAFGGAHAARRQADRWEDEVALWKDVVAQTPGAIPYGAMGNVFLERAQKGDLPPDQKEKQYKLAAEAFRQASILEPENFQTWGQLGAVHRALGQADEAITALNRAIALNPNVARYWTELGFAHAHKQQFQQAIDSYERAATLAPDDYRIFSAWGSLLARMGRVDEALAKCQAALKINPNDERALWNAARLLATRNRWPEAIAFLQRLDQLRPGSPQVADLLAAARHRASGTTTSRPSSRPRDAETAPSRKTEP